MLSKPSDTTAKIFSDSKKGKLMNYQQLKEAQDKQRAKEMERINLLLEMSFANRKPRPLNNAYELGNLDR